MSGDFGFGFIIGATKESFDFFVAYRAMSGAMELALNLTDDQAEILRKNFIEGVKAQNPGHVEVAEGCVNAFLTFRSQCYTFNALAEDKIKEMDGDV